MDGSRRHREYSAALPLRSLRAGRLTGGFFLLFACVLIFGFGARSSLEDPFKSTGLVVQAGWLHQRLDWRPRVATVSSVPATMNDWIHVYMVD